MAELEHGIVIMGDPGGVVSGDGTGNLLLDGFRWLSERTSGDRSHNLAARLGLPRGGAVRDSDLQNKIYKWCRIREGEIGPLKLR